MKGLFLLCFCLIIISCDNNSKPQSQVKTTEPKKTFALDGKYLSVQGGIYEYLDFINDSKVLMKEKYGAERINMYSYIIKNNKVYIYDNLNAAFIFDLINEDAMELSHEIDALIGGFIKEGSVTYSKWMANNKQPKAKNSNNKKPLFIN